MKTVIVTLSCLLLCFGAAVAEAPPTHAPADQEKNADGETLLAEISKSVEAGEWIEAFELLKNPPALGVDCTEARQVLVESLNLKATPDQRLQLLQLIQQYSFAIPDTAAAIKYTERICTDFPAKPDDCDQVIGYRS